MQKKQTHVPYGLIIALLLIIMNLGIVLSHQSGNKLLGWIPLLAMMAGIIMNGVAFSKANNADVTFGQDFLSCFKATLIITVLYTIWVMLSLTLFPQIKQDTFDLARKQMEQSGRGSEEVMEKALSIMERGFGVIMGLSAFFGTLIMGAIASLIGGAIAKKNPVPAQMM